MTADRGSVAAELPQRNTELLCFQCVKSWQCQAVAGVCHWCKLMKTNRKSGLWQCGWQVVLTSYPAVLLPQRMGAVCTAPPHPKIRRSKTNNAPGREQTEHGSGGDHNICLTEGVGTRRLFPTTGC